MQRAPGLSLIESLVVTAVLGIACVALASAFTPPAGAGRVGAAARRFAVSFNALRWRSVALNRSHGLFFTRRAGAWVWFEVADGNGNGLRTSEIGDGTDVVLSGPHRLEDHDERVHLGFPGTDPIPRIPPRRGNIDGLDDPVRFGRSDIVSFSPLGSASSGTLYITDGRRELFGVVLFGPTVRVRVWRYDRGTEAWKL
jgi:type II secretory pathway pseudopilin PulG